MNRTLTDAQVRAFLPRLVIMSMTKLIEVRVHDAADSGGFYEPVFIPQDDRFRKAVAAEHILEEQLLRDRPWKHKRCLLIFPHSLATHGRDDSFR